MNDIRRMTVSVEEKSVASAMWKRRIVLAVVAGITLRAIMAFGIVGDMPQMGDGPAYVEQARAILAGTVDHFYFPPGTALFTLPVFSLLGFSVFSEHLAGFCIGVFFLVSVVLLARSILASPRAVFVASVIVAAYPHVLLSTAQISSLPLTAAFVSLAIACSVRARVNDSAFWWFACAVASAAAVLVRPGTLLLPIVIIVSSLRAFDRTSLTTLAFAKPFLVTGLTISALCLPVAVFHVSGGHGFTLATNSEWNILLANNAYTPDYKTAHFGQRAIADLDPAAQSYIRQFFATETAEPASVAQRKRMLDSATAYMIDNPIRTLWRMSNRIRGFFGCDYTAAREMQLAFGYSDRVFSLIMLAEGGMYLFVLFGWLIWMIIDGSAVALSRTFQLGVLLSIISPHVLAFSLAKYHLPVVPMMICAASAVFSRLWETETGLSAMFGKHRKALIIIALLVVVIQVEHLLNLVWFR